MKKFHRLLERDIHLREAARCRLINGIHDKLNPRLNVRPLLLPEHNYRDRPVGEVLLIAHVLVRGYEHLEPGLFSCCQQFTVLEFVPALPKSRGHRMPFKIRPDWHWGCLIEKNPHFTA